MKSLYFGIIDWKLINKITYLVTKYEDTYELQSIVYVLLYPSNNIIYDTLHGWREQLYKPVTPIDKIRYMLMIRKEYNRNDVSNDNIIEYLEQIRNDLSKNTELIVDRPSRASLEGMMDIYYKHNNYDVINAYRGNRRQI